MHDHWFDFSVAWDIQTRRKLGIGSLLVFLFLCIPAIAGAQGPAEDPQAQTTNQTNPGAAADDGWHFAISPYLWFAGVHGTAGALGHEVSIHASAGDVLSHFNIGFMGFVNVRKKRFVAPLDLLWIKLSDDKSIPITDVRATTAKFKAKEFILTPKIGYRVLDKKVKVDALAGFRFWHLGQSLNFQPSVLGLNFSASQNWVDPLIGGRILAPLSPKVYVSVAGDVGGFNVGAKQDYQIVGALGYKLKPKLGLEAGWRYLDVNYRSGSFLYYTNTSGLLLGVTINLK